MSLLLGHYHITHLDNLYELSGRHWVAGCQSISQGKFTEDTYLVLMMLSSLPRGNGMNEQ